MSTMKKGSPRSALPDKAHAYLARRSYALDKSKVQSKVFTDYNWAIKWAMRYATDWSVTPLYQYTDSRPKQ